MVGFPQQTLGVFLLKMIILGWRLEVPPFKGNTHIVVGCWSFFDSKKPK